MPSASSKGHTVRIFMMTQPLALTFICLCPVFIHLECNVKKKISWLKFPVLGLNPRLKYLRSFSCFALKCKTLYFYILFLKKYLLHPQKVLGQNIFLDCPHSFFICSFFITEIHLGIISKTKPLWWVSPYSRFFLCKIFLTCNFLWKEVLKKKPSQWSDWLIFKGRKIFPKKPISNASLLLSTSSGPLFLHRPVKSKAVDKAKGVLGDHPAGPELTKHKSISWKLPSRVIRQLHRVHINVLMSIGADWFNDPPTDFIPWFL